MVMKRIYKFFLISFIMVFVPMMKLHAINWPIIEKTVNNGQTFRLDCSEHWRGGGNFGPIDFYTVNGKGKSQTDFKVDIHYYNSGSRCYYNFTPLKRGTFKVGIEVAFENLWYNGQSYSGNDMVYYLIHVLDVVSVELPSYLDLNVGETSKLNVRVTDSDANYSLKWESTNTNVATVDNNGNVKGIREGTATITCTADNGVYGSCRVTVSSIKVTNIILSTENLTLKYGANKQLTATIIPTNASNKDVTWSSSNPSVASVNSTGLVTGVNNGTSKITCTANDGSGMKAICNVSVQDSDPLPVGSTFDDNNIRYKVIGDGTVSVNSGRSSKGVVSIQKTVRHNGCNYTVKEIGDEAFYRSGLTSITIPNSVTSIGDKAFYNCSGLTSVTIGNSVKSIGSNAFNGCSGLTSITIPNSVTSIGDKAFYNCSGLTSVTIGNSVKSIGDYVFNNCTALTSVTIPNSVTSIGDYAFKSCSGLTSVTISNSVTSIGEGAFMNCSGLTSVHISDLAAWCKISFGGNYSNPLEDAHHLFLNGTEIHDLVIPNNVTSIGSRAFYKCEGLTSVTIPNSVKSIGCYAFTYCSNIKSVTIPNSVTSIDQATFASCRGLTSVTIPNSVTSIGKWAFASCSSLSSITIGNSVTSIYENAFENSCRLTSVTIPNSVTSIGSDAFKDCTGLTSITIPNSVTSIGSNAFYGTPWYNNQTDGVVYAGKVLYKYKGTMPEGTKISIKEGTVGIASHAFYNRDGLTFVFIPNSVTSIGDYAFWTCDGLMDVYCYAKDIPTTSSFSFPVLLSNATLHVPTGSVDAYKAKAHWNGFKEIVEIVEKIKLNKTKATLEKTKTLTLKATVTPSDLLDKSVTWKSSNTKVATVTSKGKVKGVKAGTATITCTSNATGAKATCKVTVGYVKLDQTEAIVKKGKTITLTPTVYPSSLTDKSVTWKSSNTKVATVTSKGKVKGVKTGTVTITCTSNATGLSTTCIVTVINGTVTLDKSEAYVQKGKTMTLKATVTPTTLEDKSVTWTSSNTAVATVSSTGKVKGVKYGTATITCTSNATGLSATCQVTVGKVIISISEFTLKRSRTTLLTATVYPSTLTDKSVTWESSNTAVATITADGKVKGIKAGTATITCTSVATGLKGTCTVTVLSTSGGRSVEGDDNTTGIEAIDESPALTEPYDVYDLSGCKVLNQTTSLDGLPDGIYIVNGRKILKK